MMYDCYMIVGDEFKNVVEDGQITGFQIGLRMPYYSSLFLSLVGTTELTVDGERYSEDDMTVMLRGKSYPKTKLVDEPDEKWEFGEVGIVTLARPGGLPPGEHTVDVRQQVSISFVEGGLFGHDIKKLTLPG